MARALRITTSRVALERRAGYVTELRARRDEFRALGCNFWVFENPDDAGAFTEFTEAASVERLAAAIHTVREPMLALALLTEVELT